MAGCLITSGIDITCDDLRVVGGVNKISYAYNFDEFTSVGFDANGYVNQINFDTSYLGLYKFEGRKGAHSGGSVPQIQEPGGNKYFQHNVIWKLFPNNPTEDSILEDVLVGTFGIILKSNNDEFFLYGLKNGMDQTEGAQDSGQEQNSDIADSLTFAGQEPERPKRILVDGSALGTQNYLDSLVV